MWDSLALHMATNDSEEPATSFFRVGNERFIFLRRVVVHFSVCIA